MINYCTRAMFGGEVLTTLVMTIFSAGLIFFIVWVIADALGKINNKIMNEEQTKKEQNYFLPGSLVIGAVILSSAWIYSAKIDARGVVPANANIVSESQSVPAGSAPIAPASPRSSGGCGV